MNYIAGLGQFIRGDDGIGLHVIEYIDDYYQHKNYKTIDLSDNIWNLLPLLETTTDKILIIDCSFMGKMPGEYDIFSIDSVVDEPTPMVNAHQTGLKQFIQIAIKADKKIPAISILGIEPADIDYSVELSLRLNEHLPQYAALAVDFISATEKFG